MRHQLALILFWTVGFVIGYLVVGRIIDAIIEAFR